MKRDIITNEFTRMDEEVQHLSSKLNIAKYIFISFFIILAGRLWYLQIYKGSDLRLYSENNRLKKQVIKAPRGLILSRDRNIMATNHLKSELIFVPQYSKDIHKAAQVLSSIIEIPSVDIVKKIQKSKKANGLFFPISLKKQLNLKQIYQLQLLKEKFPEWNIRDYIVRFYPFQENSSHALGYMGEISKQQILDFNSSFGGKFHFRSGDVIGQTGLEKFWENDLRGLDGMSFIEVDAHSRFVLSNPTPLLNLQPQKPQPGSHIHLTLDMDIQKAAIQAMNRKDRVGPRNGAVVVMKTNGEILALTSSPRFNPNIFSEILYDKNWTSIKKNLSKPLLNKVIQNHYPPGSLLKPFIALAALQENLITPDTLLYSPGRIRLGRRTFHDHKIQGYGNINIFQAIEESSNTFFYQLGQKLTIDKMSHYIKLFGLGEKTNIRLPGEITGFIPTRKWKQENLNEPWQEGEDFIHAIGQGYTLTTPIQIAIAFNALATKGLLVQPLLVQSIINSDNQVIKIFSSRIIQDLSDQIDKKHFHTVQQALKQVIHGSKGTARWWKVKHQNIAGKTGTSQVRRFSSQKLYQKCHLKPIEDRHHGWFAAFAPVEHPEVTVVVLTENSCSGSAGSAPVARDILTAYFKKYSNYTSTALSEKAP